MSLRAQFYNNNHNYKNSSHQSNDKVDFVKGEFTCGYSNAGVNILTPESALALILLEPTRNLKWKIADGIEVTETFSAGTVIIIPAHQTTSITWSEPVEILKFLVQDQELSDANLKFSELADSVISFSSRQCLQISQLILENLYEETDFGEKYLQSLYSIMVYLLSRNAIFSRSTTGAPSGLSSFFCRQIESYLKENFRSQVSVTEMAEALGISAGHFATCFRESFGQTPHQYLMRLRLDEAEKCLLETEMPISTIAARLSFSSQSHLTTALKKYRQLTPGEIRRRGSKQRFGKIL